MLVLAHRGMSGPGCPENTLASVEAALDAGADGVEVDLRLTADGVLVLSHDPDLVRLTGLGATVAQTSWAQLRAAAASRGLELARAEQVLRAARDRRIVLELKQPPPAPGSLSRTAIAVRDLLDASARPGCAQVTLSSFSPDLLRKVRLLLPARRAVRTALVGAPLASPTSLLRQALADGHDEVHPYVLSLLAAPRAVAAAHAVGTAVVPWTVNRRSEFRRVRALGVDGVITDVPVSAHRALGAPAASAG